MNNNQVIFIFIMIPVKFNRVLSGIKTRLPQTEKLPVSDSLTHRGGFFTFCSTNLIIIIKAISNVD